MTVRVWGTRYWPPGPKARTLADLDPERDDGTRERSCRFPVGQGPDDPSQARSQLFCGDEAEADGPYCHEHKCAASAGRPAPKQDAALFGLLIRRHAA